MLPDDGLVSELVKKFIDLLANPPVKSELCMTEKMLTFLSVTTSSISIFKIIWSTKISSDSFVMKLIFLESANR